MERSMVPIAYLSYLQWPVRQMNVAIRTTGDAMRLAPAVTAAVHAVDREQPIENVTTLDGLLHQEVFVFSYMAWVMGIFGAVALVLAVVGVYGVMSYAVSQQTHDIGVRIALGAPRGRVIGRVLRRGMATTIIGLAVGMLPAFALARPLAFAVWSVHAADAGTFVGIPLVLALAAAIAIYIPARRAVSIDPMAALRQE
jgi:putative ABC transport system permease protein